MGAVACFIWVATSFDMLGINKPADEHGAAWPSILVGLFAAFAGILYGYDTGTISGILEMPYWQQEFAKPGESEPTESDTSLIVSILSVGTFVGALSAGILSDITGRKWGIIVSAMIPFNLGVALQTAATEQTMFVIGRLFAGIGVVWCPLRSPCSRVKPFSSGSEELSLDATSSPSRSVFSLQRVSITQPRTAMTAEATEFRLLFSSRGP